MDTTKEVLQEKVNAAQGVLYMALEMSDKKWKLALSAGGVKVSRPQIDAGDRMALLVALERAKQRFGLTGAVKVVSCYEAGRDGFWLHRYLLRNL